MTALPSLAELGVRDASSSDAEERLVKQRTAALPSLAELGVRDASSSDAEERLVKQRTAALPSLAELGVRGTSSSRSSYSDDDEEPDFGEFELDGGESEETSSYLSGRDKEADDFAASVLGGKIGKMTYPEHQ